LRFSNEIALYLGNGTRYTNDSYEMLMEVICARSNGDIFNDIHGPLTRFPRSPHFWTWIIQKQCILRTKLL